MARIAVTGAAGFIGGALVPRLAAAGHSLGLFDNFSGPIRVEHPEHPVRHADLRDSGWFQDLRDYDVVLHLAAVSGVMACAQDPSGAAATNITGTRDLARFCRENRLPIAFASSFAVVGIPERLPITESTPARPTHEYARQKAEGEAILRDEGREGLSSAILRMSNVYGRYEAGGRRIAKGNVLNLFVEQAGIGRLTVNAPGTQRRDFIHLDDVLDHWEAAARYLADPRRGEARARVFNVASGESRSLNELAALFASRWTAAHPGSSPLRIDLVPNPRGAVELLQPEFAIDRSETERLLGVECRHPLTPSIDALVAPGAP